MNAQENKVLQSFLGQLIQANASFKDPEAAAMIADAVAKQPDATYLLVQRAILLDQALASATAQIASLQSQLQATQGARSNNSSFLDSANTWGNNANAQPLQSPTVLASAPVQMPNQPIPPSRPSFLSGGLGSTLGNIASTAAGVAGGAFLFQGIENLFHHNSGGGFISQPAMGVMPNENVVINNYENGPTDDDSNYDISDNNLMNDSFSSGNYDDDSTIT